MWGPEPVAKKELLKTSLVQKGDLGLPTSAERAALVSVRDNHFLEGGR